MQSQNGYPVITSSGECRKWILPLGGQSRHVFLHPGVPGFILACFLTYFHRVVERINTGVWDEWGWAYREIRGSTEISNHASGTAADANATQHPLGVRGTFTATQERRIRRRLRLYGGVIGWGGDYVKRADEMHFELAKGFRACRRLARVVRFTPVGLAVLRANPEFRRDWRR